MVGQASSLSVGAHGCAPFFEDRQDARRHQILFLFAITFENSYSPGKPVRARQLSRPQ
jgi:hypothetical protein